jgi:tetratricopeptide (TPR) repeat protein/tRNA A-37 threonylcarbamoyl transferase component Bud32
VIPNEARGSLSGRIFGQFHIKELLGRGGMGEVYRADDTKLKRTVAVKRVRPEFLSRPESRRLFIREVRNASKVVHPYVATVFEVIEDGETPLLVMEYIDGVPLPDIIREKHLDAETIRGHAQEITEALSAIHAAGLIHRDLKPGNIMLTRTGHIKVLDFGLASVNQALAETSPDASTQTDIPGGPVRGTVPYMSPEQLRGQTLDPRSDLFSLGVILPEMIGGQHPFRRTTMPDTVSAILNEPPTILKTDADEMSGGLIEIANQLLHKDVEKRLPQAEAVLEALRNVVITKGRTPDRVWSRAWLAVAVMALVAVSAWVGLRGPPGGGGSLRPAVVVLPVAGWSEDDDDKTGAKAAMLAGLMTSHLSATSTVRSVSQDRIREVLVATEGQPLSSKLERVSDILTAQWVLSGAVFRDANAYIGNFELHDIPAGETQSFSVTHSSLTGMAREASRQVEVLFGGDSEGDEASLDLGLFSSKSEEAQLLFQRASDAYRLTDYALAMGYLERCLVFDAEFVRARQLFAEILNAAGFEQKAQEEIGLALEQVQQRTDGTAHRIASEIEAAHAVIHGDGTRAIEIYSQLSQRYGDDPDILRLAAASYRREALFDQALAMLDRARVVDGLDPRLLMDSASLLANMNRFDEAGEMLDEAEGVYVSLGVTAGMGRVAERRAYMYFRMRRFEDAEAWYGTAAKSFISDGLGVTALRAIKSEGDMELYQWKLIEAEDKYLEVLPEAERTGQWSLVSSASNSMGALLMRARRLDEARSFLEKALEVAAVLDQDARRYSPMLNLASVLTLQGKYEESRDYLGQVLDLAARRDEPARAVTARLRLTEIDALEGDLEEALSRLQEILMLEPDQGVDTRKKASVQQRLFIVLKEMGRYPEALAAASASVDLKRELKDRGGTGYSLSQRAQGHFLVGDRAAGVTDIDEARGLIDFDTPKPLLHRTFRLAVVAESYSIHDWQSVLDSSQDVESDGGGQENLEIRWMRGMACLALERAQEAKDIAADALTQAGISAANRVRHRILLASALARLGSSKEANLEEIHAREDALAMGLSESTLRLYGLESVNEEGEK